jgi:hypothetical protein
MRRSAEEFRANLIESRFPTTDRPRFSAGELKAQLLRKSGSNQISLSRPATTMNGDQLRPSRSYGVFVNNWRSVR